MALNVDAILVTGTGAISVRLCDLSRSGAALNALVAPPPNADVTLCFHGRSLAARVAWRSGPRFGLTFSQRMRATDVFISCARSQQPPRLY